MQDWFRQANPAFQEGLVTVWNEWTLLWLRSDARPKNVVAAAGWMWLTRGAIPVSWPGQSQALIHTDGPTVQAGFAKGQWPPALLRHLSRVAFGGAVRLTLPPPTSKERFT